MSPRVGAKINYPKTRKARDYGQFKCEVCGAEEIKKAPLQRYCRPCSEVKHVERQKAHQHKRGKERYDETRTKYRVAGVALNSAERLTLETSTPSMPKMAWYRRVAVPFSWAGSKNHIFASTSQGHVYMREESRYMRSLLTSEIMAATLDAPLVQNKLWLDIFVQKPRNNGDAVNFVDMVCDAIKDAIPLDDRWYSIRSTDWQIIKHEPMLFVGIGQETDQNVQACSSCGRLLTYDFFQRNRSLPNGVGRNCRDCQQVKTGSKKRDNARLEMAIEHAVGVFG